jgi:hypothetical protein
LTSWSVLLQFSGVFTCYVFLHDTNLGSWLIFVPITYSGMMQH